ncbi:aspartate kinase, partial [Staphylococcus aureus]|nr:aspartate kinase [Staphylococcus aureus]
NHKTFEKDFQENDIFVVAGFQGINEHLDLTTLGRGGSDTTAVELAVINQIHCEIYTDVDGVYANYPRLLPKAKRLDIV